MDKLSTKQVTCFVVGIVVCLALLCSATLAAWAWLQFRSVRSSAVSIDRIAFVGADSNIYLMDRQGQHRKALTKDAHPLTEVGGRLYRFPTWSPDGRWVAVVEYTIGADQTRENTLYAIPVRGGRRKALFASSERAPFYLYWSPNSRRLAFLADEERGPLSLWLAGLEEPARRLDSGQPYYFTWAPDSTALITHVGGVVPEGRIARLDVEQERVEVLPPTPALFLAPAWSPNGSEVLVAAEMDEEGPALYQVDAQGQLQRMLVRYRGAISFVWSPDGERVAYIVTDRPRPAGLGQFAYGRVQVLRRDGTAEHVSTRESAVAFFWAPDAQKIAYLSLIEGRDSEFEGRQMPAALQQPVSLRLQWRVLDLNRRTDRALVTFVPAPGFLSVLPFFDQYAQSLTFWAPDGSALVFSAQNREGTSEIWVVTVDGGAAAQRIAAGDWPVWSWR